MIVILDTNILISSLVTPGGMSDVIYASWRSGKFQLATCAEQIAEFRVASRHPNLAGRFAKYKAGTLLNDLGRKAIRVSIQHRHTALDPTDAFLLDLASAAGAHYLVTGDKRAGLLKRKRVDGTRILTPAEFWSTVLG